MNYTLENLVVLAHFNELSQDDRNPVLAVYRGRSLTVISYDTDSCLENLTLALKKAWFAILTFFGALEVNVDTASKLKKDVDDYYFRQAEKQNAKAVNTMSTNFQSQIQTYQKELAELNTRKTKMITEVDHLQKEKEGLNQEIAAIENKKSALADFYDRAVKTFNNIQSEYKTAQQVIKNEESARKNIEKLLSEKTRLENEILELREKLEPLKKQVSQLNSELYKVQSDLSQQDYKSQTYQLQNDKEELTEKLKQAENDADYLRLLGRH